MSDILIALKNGLILDGAYGSLLMESGLTGGKTPESWVLEKSSEIRKVHAAYIKAGADVITTCTFGANRIKLSSAGLADIAEAINQQAAFIAKETAGNKCYIAGNVGPTGQLLAPNGPLTEKAALENYAEQAEILAQSGVDFLLLQTFFDLKEVLIAIKAVRTVTELPVFATMSFQETNQGFVTIMGNRVAASMMAMHEVGASVVGANCTLNSDRMFLLAQAIREAVNIPILIQPNAGSPEIINGKTIYSEDEDTFAKNMRRIKTLGVEVIGGCCGSTPEHIRRMKNRLGSDQNSKK